jgi:translation initiation factor 2B subunit (eIF-2B alpha/beta/delta family)
MTVESHSMWRVFGATEAAVSILGEFLSRVRSSSSWEDIMGSLDYLYRAYSERPYSALLMNATRDILAGFVSGDPATPVEAVETISSIVSRVFESVRSMTDQAASIASKRINDGETIFTISYSGTVLKIFESLIAKGHSVKAIVTESRPFGEGIEMAKALRRAGVDVTLIVDSAIRSFIRRASRVIIGAEAISANGAVINKIGTAILALAAREARIRVFVVSGSYKIVPETVFGELIDSPELVLIDMPEDLKTLGVRSSFPLFESIPPEYVDAIITEKGLVAPAAIPYIAREVFGSWPPRVRRISELYEEARRLIGGRERSSLY